MTEKQARDNWKEIWGRWVPDPPDNTCTECFGMGRIAASGWVPSTNVWGEVNAELCPKCEGTGVEPEEIKQGIEKQLYSALHGQYLVRITVKAHDSSAVVKITEMETTRFKVVVESGWGMRNLWVDIANIANIEQVWEVAIFPKPFNIEKPIDEILTASIGSQEVRIKLRDATLWLRGRVGMRTPTRFHIHSNWYDISEIEQIEFIAETKQSFEPELP